MGKRGLVLIMRGEGENCEVGERGRLSPGRWWVTGREVPCVHPGPDFSSLKPTPSPSPGLTDCVGKKGGKLVLLRGGVGTAGQILVRWASQGTPDRAGPGQGGVYLRK